MSGPPSQEPRRERSVLAIVLAVLCFVGAAGLLLFALLCFAFGLGALGAVSLAAALVAGMAGFACAQGRG